MSKQRIAAQQLRQLDRLSSLMLEGIHALTRNIIKGSERYQDDLRLLKYGHTIYSQCDEDGMIAEIFRRIGTDTKKFVEFGVGDGRVCNTAALLLDGWTGLWLEKSQDHAELAKQRYDKACPGLTVEWDTVTKDNANDVVPNDIDLLSIDIDGLDFWVWQAIRSKPRVVIIEYNALFPPPIRKTVEYDPLGLNDGNYFGASLAALEILGESKGYKLVGCNVAGVNAFFVRSDLVGDKFSAPFTAENHYEPMRYALAERAYYAPGIGRWQDV